jgi:hydroxyacylglutathione hydrolase
MGLHFRTMSVPGHTLSHVAYVGHGHVFCGDTLFACGCGRLFEGTPAQMLASLDRLAALPGETRVCCGHEYTEANLRFARTVDRSHGELAALQQRVSRQRAGGLPTLPTTIELERRCNPFLRCDDPSLVAAIAAYAGHTLRDRVHAFAALRAWKDAWTG